MRHFDLSPRSLHRPRFNRRGLATFPGLSLGLTTALTAGFVLTAIPVRAIEFLFQKDTYYNPQPYRSSAEDYEDCAAGLLGTGLLPEQTADACAGALYPKVLSACVTQIDFETELTAEDALFGCRRVRRPQELASCVVGITQISTVGTSPLDVLTYCRRSLLPVRFSNCVVGIATQVTTFSTTEMMTNCIAATSRPRQVLPNFIPSGQEVPLQPLPGVGNTPSIPSTPSSTPPTTESPSVPALW